MNFFQQGLFFSFRLKGFTIVSVKKDPGNSDAKIAIRRLSGMRKKFLGVNSEMKSFFVQMDEEAEFIQFERWLLKAWN